MEEEVKPRKLDELGRLVLPAEYRNKLGWKTGDTIGCKLDIQTQTIILYKEK